MNGGPFKVLLHHDLPGDLEGIPANLKKRVLDAIENRLGRAPERYGARLRQSLKGFWKLRVGDLRVVYELVGREVRVYGVMDRRDVYREIEKRTSKGWKERSTRPPR